MMPRGPAAAPGVIEKITAFGQQVERLGFAGRSRACGVAPAAMQQACGGKAVGTAPGLSSGPGTHGGPPMLLGAWRSPRWIDLAAKLQGWIASGIHTKWEDLALGIEMYRK